MRYVSTRGAAPALGFDDVLLAGPASDGGLYLPDAWPRLAPGEIAALAGLSYAEAAVRMMQPFLGGRIAADAFEALVGESYAVFGHPAVAPLVQLDSNLWLMELFHGPTLAFKDYALQLVGRLFETVLRRRGQRLTLLCATSGDTGAAAIAACRGLESVDIFVLYPRGRISAVQRRMMTTVDAPNVHNIAIDGSFDDCQDLVKALFADRALAERLKLGAVNSINWARIMAQAVYYAVAAAALGAPGREVAFAVPTGNFGNVFAGHVARRMGVPVARLVVGSNRNDILTRFFETGALSVAAVEPSLSPSMDIQISSNFERLLYELYDGDGAAVAAAMTGFRDCGRLDPGTARWQRARALFTAARLDDPATLGTIRDVHRETGLLVDPHTAVGIAAARATRADGAVPMVVLATAHPAKFPDAVETATGVRPALPPAHAGLMERAELVADLPAEREAVRAFIESRAALAGAA